jgi:hypothetical protein
LGGRVRTSEESVQFHQELEIDVLALGRLAMGVAHMVALQVDTYPDPSAWQEQGKKQY